jgi:hypothetical protein
VKGLGEKSFKNQIVDKYCMAVILGCLSLNQSYDLELQRQRCKNLQRN